MTFKKVSEGNVEILVPKAGKISRKIAPFYNPQKEFDRSLSVTFLKAFQKLTNKKLSVCDLLSASGVRGLRFACEVDGLEEVLLNELNPVSFKIMKKNVQLNEKKLKCKVKTSKSGANELLYSIKEKFDYIDVDPFGSPNPFLNSSILSLRRYGVLAITSTDTAPLCGTYPRACLRKYGSYSYRTEYYGEVGLRILAKKVIEVGAQYELALIPIFGHFSDSFFRLYSQLDYGAGRTDALLKEIGFILHCNRCLYRKAIRYGEHAENTCPKCQSKPHLVGPLFLGRIWDEHLCERMMTEARGETTILIQTILDESKTSEVTHYTTASISEVLNTAELRLQNVIDLLRKRGFKAVRTHFSPKGFKTNAGMEEIIDVFKSLTSNSLTHTVHRDDNPI